jgi:hypothetical protein
MLYYKAAAYELHNCRITSLDSGKGFDFSTSARPVVGTTKPPILWIQRVKLPECETLRNSAKSKKNVDLYIHSSIRLHGVVLNLLSSETIVPRYLMKYLHMFQLFRYATCLLCDTFLATQLTSKPAEHKHVD